MLLVDPIEEVDRKQLDVAGTEDGMAAVEQDDAFGNQHEGHQHPQQVLGMESGGLLVACQIHDSRRQQRSLSEHLHDGDRLCIAQVTHMQIVD